MSIEVTIPNSSTTLSVNVGTNDIQSLSLSINSSAASANVSAINAAGAASNALSAAVAAGAQIFETVAAGIAAVPINAVFYVPLTPSGGLDIRRKNGASTSVSIGQFLPPTQTTIDTTAGRLTKVGDFGIGAVNTSGPTLALNSATITGIYNYLGTDPNSPFGAEGGSFIVTRHAGVFITQTAFPGVSRLIATRTSSDNGATWTPWTRVYNQGNILGTVSQSAGVPTGALIERGSNANGEFTRFADGTQICTHLASDNIACGTSHFGGFRSADITWTYPAQFIAQPRFSVIPTGNTAFGSVVSTLSATNMTYAYTTVTSDVARARFATLTAIGRWF